MQKSHRKVVRGDIVKLEGESEEVVRSVSVVLHLASGIDKVVNVDEPTLVEIVEPLQLEE